MDLHWPTTVTIHPRLTVIESNPVIPDRFYQFALQTKLHLMNQTGLILEPSGLLYKHGQGPISILLWLSLSRVTETAEINILEL